MDKQTTYRNLYKLNNELGKSNDFRKMNMICVPDSITLNDAFLTSTNKLSLFLKINKSNLSIEANKINLLIRKMTNNLINNLITPNMLADSVLLIINTLYFRSKWKYAFKTENTKEEIFHSIQRQKVQMMTQNEKHCRYFEDQFNQVLELDYISENFTMGFILPKSNNNEPLISSEQFEYYISQLSEREINLIKIPKFKHEIKYKIENIFKKYGLRDIFLNLDISDIIPPGSDKVFVSDIIHNVIIIVDEIGTEAAAATALNVSLGMSTAKKINFVANHPFLYYIRFKPNNTIMFIGQYQ
jgi:serpin B